MKTKVKFQARQGDVFIEACTEIPRGAKRGKGRVILAHGEVTGHAHEIDQDSADAWRSGGETVAIKVKTATSLKHQEHGPIALKPGNYRVKRQREYAPGEIRRVAD